MVHEDRINLTVLWWVAWADSSEPNWKFGTLTANCYYERLSDYQLLKDLSVALVVHIVCNVFYRGWEQRILYSDSVTVDIFTHDRHVSFDQFPQAVHICWRMCWHFSISDLQFSFNTRAKLPGPTNRCAVGKWTALSIQRITNFSKLICGFCHSFRAKTIV